MLTITFYKDCIIDATYAEVFDVFNTDEKGNTAFTRYLDSLESYAIQIPDCYLTDNGKLDIDLSIYNNFGEVIHRFEEFNYMKLSDFWDNQSPRYCFIDDFRIINGMAVFSYSADVWHTYASLMSLRSSVLTHSRALKYNAFQIRDYRRARQIETSQIYKIVDNAYIPDIPEDLEDKVNLIVEFSAYQATTPDTVEYRDTFLAVVTPISSTNIRPVYTISEIESVVQQLVSGIPLNKLGTNWTPSMQYEFNFEIKNIYLIPESLAFYSYGWSVPSESSYFSHIEYPYAQVKGASAPNTLIREGFRFWNLSQAYLSTLIAKNTKIATIVHSQLYNVNFLNPIIFGNLSHQVSLGGRSLTPYFDLIVEVGLNAFSLKLRVADSFIDITEDYHYQPPLTTMTNEAFAAQQIAYELSILNNDLQIGSQAINITSDFLKGASQIASENYAGAGQSVGALAQRGLNTAGLVAAREALEAPINVITAAQSTTSVILNNVRVGLVAFIIDLSNDVIPESGNTDNATLAFNTDNIVGYICNVVVDSAVFYPKVDEIPSPKYNILQFDAVHVKGIFSQNISQILTKILTVGTRIWYTENVKENIAYDI